MRIPILTYHSNNVGGNDYDNNDHVALAADLRTIRRLGLRIVPLAQVVDVLDGKVSRESAHEVYGVVLSAEACTVDEVGTKERREGLRRQRGSIEWTFDRGLDGRQV